MPGTHKVRGPVSKKKMWTASEDRHPVIHLEEKWLWRAGEMAMECRLLAS